MAFTLHDLKSASGSLPRDERSELARFLLRSLEEDETNVRAEWMTLAQRRMADVKAGTVVGIPAEDVLRTLLEANP